MEKGASKEALQAVLDRVKKAGFDYQINQGREIAVIAVLGSDTGRFDSQNFRVLPGVAEVIRIMRPYKLAAIEFHPASTIVNIGRAGNSIDIGGNKIIVMAGPCSIESSDQASACAGFLEKCGLRIMRGGAFKPRTSPFAFQGLKEEGLEILARIRRERGLMVVTEVVAAEDVSTVAEYADILQVGARNMQNYRLLEAVGKAGKPVLLKNGLAVTVEEWLSAADYILRQDNPQVILCARGIRTFETATRFTLDMGIIPVVKRFSHLPIIVDPSHAAGDFRYVPALAKSAIAAGADGLIIEVHPNPKEALSDGPQSLSFSDFSRLMEGLKPIARAVGREL